MDTMERERRIEARRQRKTPQAATHLITPQIFTSSTEVLSLDSVAASFFIPLSGLLDEVGVMMDHWPDEIEELIFLISIDGLRASLEHYFAVRRKMDMKGIDEQIDKPCKVSFKLDEIKYHDEVKEGRKRVFVPTCFSAVFRPDGSVCSKVRS